MKRLGEQIQLYGAHSLSTSELLAYVLFSASTQGEPLTVASRLLDKYGVRGIKTVGNKELVAEGLTAAKARALQAVCELARRLSMPDPGETQQIRTTDEAAALLRPFMVHLDHEEFRVLVLDTKHRVVANVLLYRGTVDGMVLRAAEVFRQAITRACPGVIVAHNHPSGDPNPSPEDKETTRQLVEAGRILDIELVDHLIIGNPGYVSLRATVGWFGSR